MSFHKVTLMIAMSIISMVMADPSWVRYAIFPEGAEGENRRMGEQLEMR